MSGAFCWRSRIGRADPARSADFTLEDVGEREWECFAGFHSHGWTSHAAGDKWADRSGSRPTGDVEVGEFALHRASRDASSGPFSPGRKCAFWIAEPELRRSVQVFSFQFSGRLGARRTSIGRLQEDAAMCDDDGQFLLIAKAGILDGESSP